MMITSGSEPPFPKPRSTDAFQLPITTMRFILVLFTGLCLLACQSPAPALTEQAFAKIYLDSLSKKYPDVRFALNADLSITAKKGDLDYKHYTNNAFIAYKNAPDSVGSVITRYMAATAEFYTRQPETVNINHIIPVIKSVEYLAEINALNKAGKSLPMVTEKYNDQLIIAYAEDSENSVKYLTEEDLQALAISRDTLKSIALRNLAKLIPDIKRRGNYGLFMVIAGGTYESSLILLPSIWNKEQFPVEGSFVIALPSRNMLMITGSKDKKGMDKIKEIVAESSKTENYLISKDLYQWTGKKFEK